MWKPPYLINFTNFFEKQNCIIIYIPPPPPALLLLEESLLSSLFSGLWLWEVSRSMGWLPFPSSDSSSELEDDDEVGLLLSWISTASPGRTGRLGLMFAEEPEVEPPPPDGGWTTPGPWSGRSRSASGRFCEGFCETEEADKEDSNDSFNELKYGLSHMIPAPGLEDITPSTWPAWTN